MFIGVKLRITEWFCHQTFRNRFSEYFSEPPNVPIIYATAYQTPFLQSFKSLTVLQALLLFYFLLHLDKMDLIQFMYDW